MRALFAFVVFALAAVAGVLVVRDALSEAHRHEALDPAVWRRPVASCTDSPRERMVKDVVAHHLPHGLAVSRVRSLLGPPDEIEGGVLVYYVGAEFSGIGPSTCVWLEIRTRKGRVNGARVVRNDG